jgi:hypothetical protein
MLQAWAGSCREIGKDRSSISRKEAQKSQKEAEQTN